MGADLAEVYYWDNLLAGPAGLRIWGRPVETPWGVHGRAARSGQKRLIA